MLRYIGCLILYLLVAVYVYNKMVWSKESRIVKTGFMWYVIIILHMDLSNSNHKSGAKSFESCFNRCFCYPCWLLLFSLFITYTSSFLYFWLLKSFPYCLSHILPSFCTFDFSSLSLIVYHTYFLFSVPLTLTS